MGKIMRFIRPWIAPKWVPKAVSVPSTKALFANGPTPIEPWDLGFDDVQCFIKRDDLTGTDLTGNKVRKLDFLLADAVDKNCDTIIAWGAATSNHCRTTAICAAKMGLDCHLLLTNGDEEINYNSGNITLASAVGAKLYRMEACSFAEADDRMDRLAKKLESKGKKPYIIPRGGSSDRSIWGYIDCWSEMENQDYFNEITDIVVVSGSGGTGLDLALANYWSGFRKRVHGVRIWGESKDFFSHAKHSLEQAGIENVPIEDIIDIIDGYVGKGYADSWPELRQLSLDVAENTGIFVDRVYTAKAILALKTELKKNPERFQGENILFVHTGGIYGFIDGSMTDEIKSRNPISELSTVLDLAE